MIVSLYTFLFEAFGEYYVYNSLSNSLLELDIDTYNKLLYSQHNAVEIDKKDFDDDLYSALSKAIIITDSDDDDLLVYKSNIYAMRSQNRGMHLTIAPTMECCFNCHYCFEKNKPKGKMSEHVMEGIVKYVESKPNLGTINITWFGGEPLMAVEEIELLYDKLKPIVEGKDYKSNIITTGYFMDDNIVRVLEKVGVDSVQITLDGMKESHNKVKNFRGSGDVFERVMCNVAFLNDKLPNVSIVIRVNLTKDNSDEYVQLVDMLNARFSNRSNIVISPAFVLDKGRNSCHGKTNSSLFSHCEKSKYILDLYHKGYGSSFVRYPSMFFYECAIRNDLAISFDANGFAYKCWEMLGNKEYSIGQISDDGVLKNVNIRAYNRQMFGADPLDDLKCRKCKYLPICNGGCPIHRIQNEFEGDHNNCCTYYKGFLEDFLKIHIANKKKLQNEHSSH